MNRIEIVTERLILKPLGTEHFQTAKEYSMDYENTKYMCRLPHETSEEVMEFLSCVDAEWKKENPEYFEFAIFYEGKHIGAVSIYFENCAGELWLDFKQKILGKRIRIRSCESHDRIFCGKYGNIAFRRPLRRGKCRLLQNNGKARHD